MATTNAKVKSKILREIKFLEGLRKIIEEGGKTLEVQKKVQQMPYRSRGWLPEVESPELNNTGGDWIRLHLNYCYLFIHPDGSYEYQLDPYSSYGSEVINTGSYESFVEEVKKFENIRQYSFEYIYGVEEEYV